MSDIQLHHGDCLELMKDIPDGSVDCVITDPPYGIGYDNKKLNRKSSKDYGKIKMDSGEIDYKKMIQEMQRIAKRTIIFGAINFFHSLPYKGIWLCWDKRTKVEADGLFGSPFELAWCDKIGGYDKIYRLMHGGVVNADGANCPRMHPTQKPVLLMKTIIQDFSEEGQTICDPFMGSGTTGVACAQTGRKFIGIELDPKYFQIAKRRIEGAQLPLL